MMTETELMGKCLAKALYNAPKSFGGDQAKTATGVATAALQANKCDAETFGRVIARLGNHSALRQWAVQHGFITIENDALGVAVSEEIAVLKENEAAELKKL